ncbi:glycosyltransferase family 90 protein [Tortispora caseinolytica NRRL Y-17796]|uniref:Glycosyltransferase family 90 protein n=1 Tax=Tortispora caseinolytica NRRL Y-17796 TaxID=767744 RepID=A0A1E4TCF8_9ASCO|nr:glycosyltransferase family 90 protein [Tortispora caseinolytica NRRL Y-17796]
MTCTNRKLRSLIVLIVLVFITLKLFNGFDACWFNCDRGNRSTKTHTDLFYAQSDGFDDKESHNLYNLALQKGIVQQEEIGAFSAGDPIQTLIVRGLLDYHSRLTPNRPSLAKLTRIYIDKHQRAPPPHFDIWYQYATSRNVWDLTDFDRIYDDLRPFWGVPPETLRAAARRLQGEPGMGIIKDPGWRMNMFLRTLDSFVEYLPDMDIAVNILDEPRVLASFVDINRYNAIEESTRKVVQNPKHTFTSTNDDTPDEKYRANIPFHWIDYSYHPGYDLIDSACPPDSLVFDPRPVTELRQEAAKMYLTPKGGFVRDFNYSMDVCNIGPYARYNHGYLAAPEHNIITRDLVPIFTESKLNVNNDILYPPNMHFSGDETFDYDESADLDFMMKEDKAPWRGLTTEGTNRPDVWDYFQRHRLVNLFNSSKIAFNGESKYKFMCSPAVAQSLGIPGVDGMCYKDPSSFLDKYSDMAFTSMYLCSAENCDIEQLFYSPREKMSFKDVLRHKYLFDVDGTTFSGRFLAFLQCSSLPFKSTIFHEWHDSRLIPWGNFIPLDITFDEAFAAFVYFTGFDNYTPPRLKLAARIANAGKDWSAKVMRKDDMLAYKFLLLLEYGRLLDDERESLGFYPEGFRP